MAIGATAIQAAHAEHVEIKLLREIPCEIRCELSVFFRDFTFFITGYFRSTILDRGILTMQVTKMKVFNFLLSCFVDNNISPDLKKWLVLKLIFIDQSCG